MHNGVRYKCEICASRFRNWINLKNHKEQVHEGKKLLQSGISSVYEGKKPFKCDICDSTFVKKGSLHDHTRTQHEGVKAYECNICKMRFGDKSHVYNHKKGVHQKDKPFKCPICITYSSMYQSALNIHIAAVHEGKKPFECSNCNSKFASNSLMRRHYKLIHEDKSLEEHICPYCDRIFKLKQYLKRHIEIYEGKRYECTLCQKTYSQAGPLKQHFSIVHDGQKRLNCEICDLDFKSKQGLFIHIKRIHKGEEKILQTKKS